MRMTIIATVCLVSVGMVGATASAATFSVSAPGLVGTYQAEEGMSFPDFLYPLTAGTTVSAGVKFSSISQIKVRLTGTLQPYSCDGGIGMMNWYPTWFMVTSGGSAGSSPSLAYTYDYTRTCNPASVPASMLNGLFDIAVTPICEFDSLWSGGCGPIIPAEYTIATATLTITGEPVAGTLVGDIDGNGSVNILDLLALAGSWGKSQGDPDYDARCDLNGDNAVNVVDLLTLSRMWGNPQ